MPRKFRRRPPHWVTIAIVAIVVIGGRVAHLYFSAADTAPDALPEGEYKVERAVDGDTIIVIAAGRRRYVRLIGIDTPEVFDPRGTGKPLEPPEAFAEEASAFTKQFISGGRVRLQFGRNRLDKFDRLRAFVYVGDELLNEEIVRAGLARVDSRPGDASPQIRRMEKAQREAQDAQRGIWPAQP